jgi:transposase
MSTITIGLDLGDRHSRFCELSPEGIVLVEGRLPTTWAGFARQFEAHPPCRIVCEVGTHSPWVSRVLSAWGHEVLVANARQVRLIYAADRKSDRIDAATLARLGRFDPALLRPIRHRGAEAQAALAQLRARDALVRVRTLLINHVRGAVKATRHRLPASSAVSFARRAGSEIPPELHPALAPLVRTIAAVTDQIGAVDHQLEALARSRYPETVQLRQVGGVGLLIALAFVLTVEDPARFGKSREIGPYLGLCPRQADSGRYEPELRISKRGLRSSAGCWSAERNTSSGPSVQTAPCGAKGSRRLPAEGRTPRNAPWLPPLAGWRCCCIDCGSAARCTSRIARRHNGDGPK